MNIVIIEDSRLARNELRQLLKDHREYTIVGEAATVTEGRQVVDSLKPDVLLLDIQLPDGDGFSLLEQLRHIPQVIFTTAYDQHAVSAFEVNALDYLLKPIEKERLLKSLARAQQIKDETPTPEAERLQGKIFIRDGEKYYFVQLEDIYLFEIVGNYSRAFFEDQKPLISRSLNYLEQRLDPGLFFRANRQQIINLNHIAKVEPWVNDGLRVILSAGCEIEVSRRQSKQLIDRLEV